MNWDDVFAIGVTMLLPFILIIVPLLVLRNLRTPPEKKFRKVYSDLSPALEPSTGLVLIRFWSYDGFLFWFTQTEHQGWYSPDDARTLLNRLARYNLTWGLFAAGGVFVPILTAVNYWSQRRAVQRQVTEAQSQSS